jgi:superfamily II helicase
MMTYPALELLEAILKRAAVNAEKDKTKVPVFFNYKTIEKNKAFSLLEKAGLIVICGGYVTPTKAGIAVADVKHNKEFIEAVRGPIEKVWNQIAPDVLQLGEMSNAACVESCIDADRLTQFSPCVEDRVADAMITNAIRKAPSYNTTLNYLARNIKLGR